MTKSTRRALLSSVVALVICVTMLVGTTFAWFTDTASTAVNTIQSGTLKVELLDDEDNSLEGKTLSWKKAEGHETEAILWEPGCTYSLERVTIKNAGNLALKYQVVITGIEGDAKLNDAIDWTIKVLGTADENTVAPTYKVGDEIKLGVGEFNTLTISGTMDTAAGNEYQGLTIDNIAITVYATQDTVEYDSATNEYDKDATFNNGANVITTDATLNGTYIALDENGNDSGDKNAVYIKEGNVTIEGGYYDGRSGGDNAAVRVDTGATLTIKDGYFTVGTDANGNGNNLIYAAGGDITIEGGTFYAPYTYDNRYWALNCQDGSNGSITVKGGKFYKFNPAEASTKGTTSYVGKKEISVADGYEVVKNGDWYYVVSTGATFVSDAEGLANAVQNGGYIVLTDNITANDIISITNDVTIYGYGNTITAATKKDRIFNVQGTSNDISIVLNNVVLDAADAERAISFYDNSGKIRLEMNNCTVTADHYALNIAKNNSDIEVNVKNSELTGYAAAQTWSANSKLTFENCTLNGVNKWNDNGNGDNDFATINVVNTATNATVILKNCNVVNQANGTADQYFFSILADATVTATDCTFTDNGTTIATSNVTDYCNICDEGTLTLN